MTTETDSILSANKAGYHSIPRMSPDDFISLEHVPDDQDLVRDGRKSKIFNSRFLFGLAVLAFLGVAGQPCIRRRDDSAQTQLLRTTSDVESTELVVVSSDTTTSYEDLFYANMIESPVSQSSQCGGPFIPAPIEHPGLKPQFFCSPKKSIAKHGMIDIIGEITGDAMGDKRVLVKALTALGYGTTGIGAGAAVGIVFVLGKAWLDMVCESDGDSSTTLQIKDVEEIAKFQVDKTLNEQALNELTAYEVNLGLYRDFGCTMADLQNQSRDYFQTALSALPLGIVGVQTVTNAAITSDLLLDAWKEAAESINDQTCCEIAIEELWRKRQLMKHWYPKLKKKFDDYKTQIMDERKWVVGKRKPWACLYGYANQYVVYVKGNDGSDIAHGWSPGENTWGCPSNEYQIGLAKNEARPKVEEYLKDLEEKIFYPELKAWYTSLGNEVAWTCNGERYVPKRLRETEWSFSVGNIYLYIRTYHTYDVSVPKKTYPLYRDDTAEYYVDGETSYVIRKTTSIPSKSRSTEAISLSL